MKVQGFGLEMEVQSLRQLIAPGDGENAAAELLGDVGDREKFAVGMRTRLSELGLTRQQ